MYAPFSIFFAFCFLGVIFRMAYEKCYMERYRRVCCCTHLFLPEVRILGKTFDQILFMVTVSWVNKVSEYGKYINKTEDEPFWVFMRQRFYRFLNRWISSHCFTTRTPFVQIHFVKIKQIFVRASELANHWQTTCFTIISPAFRHSVFRFYFMVGLWRHSYDFIYLFIYYIIFGSCNDRSNDILTLFQFFSMFESLVKLNWISKLHRKLQFVNSHLLKVCAKQRSSSYSFP